MIAHSLNCFFKTGVRYNFVKPAEILVQQAVFFEAGKPYALAMGNSHNDNVSVR